MNCINRACSTLGHELAHAAVWVISHSKEGHGQIWQGWMQRIHVLYPGFDMSTRHGYAIHKPHRWQCQACNSLESRHSKSVKPTDAWCVLACAREAHQPTHIFQLTPCVPARPNRSKRCGAPGRLKYLGDKNWHSRFVLPNVRSIESRS